MDTSDFGNRPTTDETAMRRLLPGLWLALAVGFVVLPFLSQFRIRTWPAEDVGGDIPSLQASLNGWGQWDGNPGGHGTRIGILFATVAALLIIAALATIASRRTTWPTFVGLLAGAAAVAATALHLLELYGKLLIETDSDSPTHEDVTVGLAAWLLLGLGGLVVISIALSFVRLASLRRRTPQPPAAWATRDSRPPFVLLALWVTAAAGLIAGPLLGVYGAGHHGESTVEVDGWGRADGSLGIVCSVLAVGLVVAAIALAVRRTTIWPSWAGLVAGTAAITVSGFVLLRFQAADAIEDSVDIQVTLGIGGWLLLATGVLAAVTLLLTLIHQRRLQLG